MKISELQSETRLLSYRKNAFAFLLLCFTIFLVYSNTFHSSWHLDDQSNITENSRLQMRELTWSQIGKAILASPRVTFDVITVRPVSRFTLALNYYLGRDDVFGYHVVNLSIHIIASIFLYLLIHHTLNLPLIRARYGSNAYFISLLAALLWAINPIQTQAVTYIIQRMTSMAGMFYIMTLYFYLKGRIAGDKRTRFIFMILCAMSGLLSLGSKENSILLPLSLFIYDLVFLTDPTRENLKRRLKAFLFFFVFPVFTLCAVLFLSTDFISNLFRLYEMRPFTPGERLLTEPRVLAFYLGLIFRFNPAALSVDHDFPLSASLLDPPTTLPALLLVAGMILGSLFLWKSRPLTAFAVLFFFLNHLIESTILPLELVFEHRNYVPSMFLFLPVAAGLFTAISFFSRKPLMQGIIVLFVVLLVIGEGHATFIRNLAWTDEKALWLDTLNKYPRSFRAHHNLGLYYDKAGEPVKALSEYMLALQCETRRSRKEKAITHFNLGIIFQTQKIYIRAMHHYKIALELDPCLPGAHNNLALVLEGQGYDIFEVKKELEKEIKCGYRRHSAIAYGNLGILLQKKGRPEQGMEALEKSLEMDPENILTMKRLGYVYLKNRLWGKACIYLSKALRHDSEDIRTLVQLGEAYRKSDHAKKAEQTLSKFLDMIRPADLLPFLKDLEKDEGPFDMPFNTDPLKPLLWSVLRNKASQDPHWRIFLETQKELGLRRISLEYPEKKEAENRTASSIRR